MTTGCGKFEDAILDLVYGELDDTEAASLRSHAADCPSCAAAVSEMSATRRLSSQALIIAPPVEIDNAVLAEARAAAEAMQAPALQIRAVAKDKPGIFELLRGWLLHPAFAGAMVVGLVLTVTFFVSEKVTSPNVSPTSVESVIAEHPMETVGAAPKTESIEEEEQFRNVKDPKDESESKKAALPEPTVAAAEPEEISAPIVNKPAAGASDGKSSVASRRSKSPASSGAMTHKPAAGIPYAAPKGEASSKSSGAGYRDLDNSTSFAAPLGGAVREQAPTQMDDLTDFAAPPAKKKALPADEGMAEEAEAPSQFPAKEAARAPSPQTSDAYSRGMEAYRRGDCNTASAELTNVIASPSAYPGMVPSALHHLARCEKRSGRCAAAVRWYDELIHPYPAYSGRGDALFEAAACCKRLGRTEKARSLLQTLESMPGWGDRAREAAQEL